MKKRLLLLLLLLIPLSLTACGQNNERVSSGGLFNTTRFDTYAYLPKHLESPVITERVERAWTAGERIFFYYTAWDIENNAIHGAEVVFTSFLPDGSDAERRTIPGDFETVEDELNTLFPDREHRLPRQTAAMLRDGRIVGMLWDDAGNPTLREIDPATGEWNDEDIPVTAPGVLRLFSAWEDADFDLLMDNGSYLFGYNLQSGERTLILNWLETGFTDMSSAHVLFLDDGRIFVLMQTEDWLGDEEGWHIETAMILLTPTPRADLPERVTITLGGFWLSSDIMREIAAFNRESRTHRIELIDYNRYNTETDHGIGFSRFQMDLLTGGGPDIIFGAGEIMADAGLLVDLNPFLVTDPELNRADFFPNVLNAMETPDGTLPWITNEFSIRTMIGRMETVGHIDTWTHADLLALMETPAPYPLGFWVTGQSFIMEMMPAFIDWHRMEANLDSEAFIRLLEVASRLPASAPEAVHGVVSAFIHIPQGEQLLSMAFLGGIETYRVYAAALENITTLGMPTDAGGAHMIHLDMNRVGINVASDRAEDAWAFVRRLLLPAAEVSEYRFPLRIDLYEAGIAEAMTPRMSEDEDGNEAEVPLTIQQFGFSIELYAMTTAEAQSLRAIIDTAQPGGRYAPELWEMALEELLPFFAGDRTAADTARIIQNRVRIYLLELR
ncbi:MAG: hypothetical protein FWE08_02555 [Oscillospiraceae bacterium]|nr:hypothetical protein [Oscillospiraceae bacterium]